jgi:hypothetical protein
MGTVVIKSRARDRADAHHRTDGLTVGVSSKDPEKEQVMSCFARCSATAGSRRSRSARIPSILARLAQCIGSLDASRATAVVGAAGQRSRAADLVVAGNSTGFDSLVAGRPAGYVRGFDHGPYDMRSLRSRRAGARADRLPAD